MLLGAADVAALPVPAALFDRDGALLAQSPEWCGGGPGSVVYRLPTASLAVACDEQDADVGTLMAELVSAMRDAARQCESAQRGRLEALASSIALVAGIPELREGSTQGVLDNLDVLLATVSTHPVRVVEHAAGSVPDAAVMALTLRQLVINARRHDDATDVRIDVDPGPTFRVQWHGHLAPEGISTARHQADRDRWGLGFVRLAMDALGGVYLAPASETNERLTAVLSIDPSPRLQLPLAMTREGVIRAASPAWDEETHLPPGSPLPRRWSLLVDAAARTPGVVQRDGTARARTVATATWIAIPPEGMLDRARDVIRGMEHERDLLDAPQPFATVIQGLTAVIALLLGDRPHRITASEFNQQYPTACMALGVPSLAQPFVGAAAPDPALVAVLAARFGAVVNAGGERVTLTIFGTHRSHPIAQRLADERGVIALP